MTTLEIEAIRDSMLFVSGQLDRSLGGSLLQQPSYSYVTNDQSDSTATIPTGAVCICR